MVKGQWGNLARMPGFLMTTGCPGIFNDLGIFNDHRESGPRFNVSTEGRCFLQYSVPVTTLGR